jgi:hypothetical protein
MAAQPAGPFEQAVIHNLSWLQKQSWYRHESYYGTLPTETASQPKGNVLLTNRSLTAEEEREVLERFGDVPVRFLQAGPAIPMSVGKK